ncbi:TPA: acetyltransferase [Vibrio cholerae]|nr:acetyltransferase [Vibrio cholerae]HDL8944960.1 acetyltransferase [Vibrio cholerae]
MVASVVFEFSGMRCQPLRRALTVSSKANNYRGIYVHTATSCET